VAKLSISVPDDLVEDLRGVVSGNVSAFVATAIRHELDRRRLFSFLEELDEELGPVDEGEIGYFVDVLAQTAQAGRPSSAEAGPKGAERNRAS
jgi:post-segregation antitoxin (ccd killing protein)